MSSWVIFLISPFKNFAWKMNRIFVNEFRLLFDCCLSSLLIFCELFPAATAGSLAGRPTACCNRPNRIFELFLQTARRLLSVCVQLWCVCTTAHCGDWRRVPLVRIRILAGRDTKCDQVTLHRHYPRYDHMTDWQWMELGLRRLPT